VLSRGCLSHADAADIGQSVTSALETLHAHGFVHEHIEPRNIYSAGDTVKLRSDCIRETPEGAAGTKARQQDVHDLANVLMRVLIGTRRLPIGSQMALLPTPFDEIVRNGTDGSWGLAEIKAALGELNPSKGRSRKEAPSKAAPPNAAFAAPARPPIVAPPVLPTAISATAPDASKPLRAVPPVRQDQVPTGSEARSEARSEAKFEAKFESAAPDPSAAYAYPLRKHSPMELPVLFGISEHDFRKWRTIGVVILGAVLIGWIIVHQSFSHGAGATAQPDPAQPAVAASHPAATPRTESSAVNTPIAPATHSQPGVQWRVVVYTYKSKEQAQKKASSLAHRHPELSPAAFSPMNRAPWLVTIGGALERDKAYELAGRARSLGLPRDAYAQNYKTR